jgi:hypothetical protein
MHRLAPLAAELPGALLVVAALDSLATARWIVLPCVAPVERLVEHPVRYASARPRSDLLFQGLWLMAHKHSQLFLDRLLQAVEPSLQGQNYRRKNNSIFLR